MATSESAAITQPCQPYDSCVSTAVSEANVTMAQPSAIAVLQQIEWMAAAILTQPCQQ